MSPSRFFEADRPGRSALPSKFRTRSRGPRSAHAPAQGHGAQGHGDAPRPAPKSPREALIAVPVASIGGGTSARPMALKPPLSRQGRSTPSAPARRPTRNYDSVTRTSIPCDAHVTRHNILWIRMYNATLMRRLIDSFRRVGAVPQGRPMGENGFPFSAKREGGRRPDGVWPIAADGVQLARALAANLYRRRPARRTPSGASRHLPQPSWGRGRAAPAISPGAAAPSAQSSTGQSRPASP